MENITIMDRPPKPRPALDAAIALCLHSRVPIPAPVRPGVRQHSHIP